MDDLRDITESIVEFDTNFRIFEDQTEDQFTRCRSAWFLLRLMIRMDLRLGEMNIQLQDCQIESCGKYIVFLMKNGASFKDIYEEIGKVMERRN